MKVKASVVHDQIVVSGESIVLLDGEVIRLSELATTILAETNEWCDVGELAVRLERRFGPAPDGVGTLSATQSALRDLEQNGLIVRG